MLVGVTELEESQGRPCSIPYPCISGHGGSEERRNYARVHINVRDMASMDKIGQMSSCSPRHHVHFFFPGSVPTACT